MSTPAERFRNELNFRLCSDAHLCLPSANILVGVLIDAMEFSVNPPKDKHSLPQSTLQNVIKVTDEITSLGKILNIHIRVGYKSVDDIPLRTLHAARTLNFPPLYLTQFASTPLAQTAVTLLTYLAVVDRLSEYIGPKGVRDLVRDFNRTNGCMRESDSDVRRVPGVGPRKASGGSRRASMARRASVGPRRASMSGLVRTDMRRRRDSGRREETRDRARSLSPRQNEPRDLEDSPIPGTSKSDLGHSRTRTTSPTCTTSSSGAPYEVLDTSHVSRPLTVERGRRSMRGLEYLRNKLRSRSRA